MDPLKKPGLSREEIELEEMRIAVRERFRKPGSAHVEALVGDEPRAHLQTVLNPFVRFWDVWLIVGGTVLLACWLVLGFGARPHIGPWDVLPGACIFFLGWVAFALRRPKLKRWALHPKIWDVVCFVGGAALIASGAGDGRYDYEAGHWLGTVSTLALTGIDPPLLTKVDPLS